MTQTNALSGSQGADKIDLKSQKSFKTHDSKTIVTVATQIQILGDSDKKQVKDETSEKASEKPS